MPESVAEIKPRAKRRKITLTDVEDMAGLLSHRLTETEACACLKILPNTWFTWKSVEKNNSAFSNIFARVRGAAIQGHLKHILKAQKKDWRASDRLLQMRWPERFGIRQETNVQIQMVAGLPDEVLNRLRAGFGKAEQIGENVFDHPMHSSSENSKPKLLNNG